jgi:L-ascorbate metabolism protein UlaG (beta-lactamase superfamily)
MMRVPFIAALALGSLLTVGACWRPTLRRYDEYFTATTLPPIRPGREVRATFLGVTTIYLTDGRTHLMIDGYLTHPDIFANGFSTEVGPSRPIIQRNLERAGISKLDAVFVAHTHFDHVLDSPVVAEMTGAKLVGSKTAGMIARGYGFPEDRFVLVEPGVPMRFGDFTVTAIRTRHGPMMFYSDGQAGPPDEPEELTEPIVPPAAWPSYPVGECYAFHIAHPLGNVVVQPSAGYVAGQFDGFPADVVFLGIARLGGQTMAYRRRYFTEVVRATGAKRIIPVHWDNYAVPLSDHLEPTHNLVDDFHDAMRFLIKQVDTAPDLRLEMLQGFDEVVLFGEPG